jgi:ferritin-like metal-binding protein YciE
LSLTLSLMLGQHVLGRPPEREAPCAVEVLSASGYLVSLTYVMWRKTMARSEARRQSRGKNSPDANELLVLELQQIHSAESQLSRALPRLSKSAQSQALRDLLDERLEEGERVLKEVESALDDLDESPGRRKNVAAEGLIADLREHAQEIENGPALDAVLIAGIQKTEHYCIAAWGTARSLARAVEEKTTLQAMERALKVGGPFDEKLTQLAEEEITPALVSGESGEEESEDDEDEAASGNGGSRKRGGRSEQRAGR